MRDGDVDTIDGDSGFSALQRSPLTDQVVEQITARILSGQLTPGTPLRQARLANELSVSRTPLREALRVLRTDGLVIQRPNGTFAVIAPTLDDARDTYALRAVIDPFAARMAATRATPEQIVALERLVSRLEETCEPFDGPRYLAAVADFHVGLLEASGNRAVMSLETTIRMSTRVLYPHLDQRRERLIAAAREHRNLYEAIRDREPGRAEKLATDHVEAVIRFWLGREGAVDA